MGRARWVVTRGAGKPVTKRRRNDEADRPMTRVEVKKALRDELERQLRELSRAERRELVAMVAKRAQRRDEIGDRGGGVAAISIEDAYGRTTRLAGSEAGDPMAKRKRPSFRDVLVDQQPTRNTTSLGYKRLRD